MGDVLALALTGRTSGRLHCCFFSSSHGLRTIVRSGSFELHLLSASEALRSKLLLFILFRIVLSFASTGCGRAIGQGFASKSFAPSPLGDIVLL